MHSAFDQMCTFNQLAYMCGISSVELGSGIPTELQFGLGLVLRLGLGLRVVVRALIKSTFARRAAHLVNSDVQIDQMCLTR